MLSVEFLESAPNLSKLSKKYDEVAQLLQELPAERLEEVEAAVPHALHNLSEWKEKLLSHHTTILLSADTKEDLVQLTNWICCMVIFDPAFPDSHTCLRICYSDNPKLILHQKDTSEEVSLHQNLGTSFPIDDIKRNLCQSIDLLEIQWPVPALQQCGIALVVVPPGEDCRKKLLNSLQSCLVPPTGILYHVSGMPGNIQPQRVRTLISAIESIARPIENRRVFDPKCLLFVNDQHITSGRITSGRITGVISKVWKWVTGENLITLSDDADCHEDQIVRFCHSSFQSSVENSYRYLSCILKRAYLSLKGYISDVNDTTYDTRDVYKSILKRLAETQTKSQESTEEIQSLKEKEISSTIANVSSFLKNYVTREKLTNWSSSECPDIKGDMDFINATFLAKVLVKIRQEINQWDSRTHIFENMHRRLLDAFKTRFSNIEGQLANIESSLLNGDMIYSDASSTGSSENDHVNMGFSVKFQVALALATHIPIGDVFDHDSLVYIKEKLPHRTNLKEYISYYEGHKVQEMRDITEIILKALLGDVGINTIIKDKLDMFVDELDGLVQKVPTLIQTNKDIVDNLISGCEMADEKVRDLYLDKFRKAQTLTGELDLFYLNELRHYDIQLSDFTSWDDIIAEGTYGKVQLATLKMKEEHVQVAVKMMKDKLTVNTASGVVAESESLRHLQKPHIVTYYGTAFQELHGGAYPLMVMEYCPTTLDKHILGKDVMSPGRYPSGSEDRSTSECAVARWAYQISSGLMNIHQMGYMHRDLKPQNILIDSAGDVKLADLGLAKPELEVKNTLCGTPFYIAPEVLRGSKYMKAADMYSFSMILCEMWMGKYVCHLYKLPDSEIERGIQERKLRPTLSPNSPEGKWKDLIETCWDEIPQERYSANYCCNLFSKLMKH